MVNQDTPEPPAGDGYVSRNVYDYDEPEPPADVREALASAWQEGFDHAITWTEGPDWADAPRNPYRPDAIEEVRRG